MSMESLEITKLYAKLIGENLRKYRKLFNYTQQNIADLLFIERTTYTKYELGTSSPPYIVIYKLSKIYNVDFNTILNVDLE